jgi:hypothetical protein
LLPCLAGVQRRGRRNRRATASVDVAVCEGSHPRELDEDHRPASGETHGSARGPFLRWLGLLLGCFQSRLARERGWGVQVPFAQLERLRGARGDERTSPLEFECEQLDFETLFS